MRPGSDGLNYAPGEVERSGYLPDQPWGWRDPWSIPPDGYHEHGMAVPYDRWSATNGQVAKLRRQRLRGAALAPEEGARIDVARLNRGWTRDELARASGVNRRSLTDILAGVARIMPDTRARLLAAVGLTP